jgi:hypothetical protein
MMHEEIIELCNERHKELMDDYKELMEYRKKECKKHE